MKSDKYTSICIYMYVCVCMVYMCMCVCAFDKVSRLLLVKSLIKLGIGSCLLEAIKMSYKVTRCVLKGFGKLPDLFQTFSGIMQGALSSVILFIIFMDDVIKILKEKCVK